MKAPHGFALPLPALPPAPTHSLVPFGCLLLWLLVGLNSLWQQADALQQTSNLALTALFLSSSLWALYLVFLCYHSLYWTSHWQRNAPHHMVALFGVMLPLVLWVSVGKKA